MAVDRDELQAQLALIGKMNAAMQQLASNAVRVRDGYKQQLETVQGVHDAIQKVASGVEVDSLDQLAKNLQKVSSAAAGIGGSQLQQLIDKSGVAEDSIDALGEKLMATGKKAGFAAGFIGGLVKGFRGIVATSKATLGFFSGLFDWITTVSAAIIAIPFRVLEGLMNLAARSANGMNELRRQIEEVRKAFGDLGGPGSDAIIVTTKTLKGFSDTGLTAWRIFGTLAERMQKVREVAVAMGASFSVLHQEFVDNGGAVLAYQKALGVADEEMKSLGNRAITMGDTLTKTMHDISKQSLGLGKAFAVDQKLIGREISKATKDVKHFGQVTVKEIGVAAVYARKLGVELERITGTLDAFETFDSAAENAAKLSQSFGVQVDAFKMMAAQNPAEQIEMLRQQFKAAGQDASQFNRQQLKLLATSVGLDEATTKQVFSAKNYGVSLNDVKKQAEASEKKGLSQAEAMSKLADSIERLIKDGPALQGSFFRMFIDGFLRGIQVSRPFMLLMRNIRQSLHTVMRIGVEFGRSFVQNFDGVKDGLLGLADMFKPERFRKLGKALLASFNDLLKGKIDVSKFMDNAFAGFGTFIDGENGAFGKVKTAFVAFFKRLSKLAGPALEWAGKEIGKAMSSIADYISGRKKLPGVDTSGASSAVGEIMKPIVDGIKESWPTLKKGLEELFDALSDRIVELLESDRFKSIAKKVAVPLALALFGPAVIQGVIMAGVPMLLKGLVGIVTGSFSLLAKNPAVMSSVGGFFRSMGGLFTRGFSALTGVLSTGVRMLAAPLAAIGSVLFASVNVSDAFDSFRSDLVGAFGETNATIGAGTAGLIDTMTLGLLPDRWIGELARGVAEITSWLDEKMSGMFGGLYTTVKEGAAKVFEMLDFFGKGLSNVGQVWDKVDFSGAFEGIISGKQGIVDTYMKVSEQVGNAVFDATHKGAEKGMKAAAAQASAKPSTQQVKLPEQPKTDPAAQLQVKIPEVVTDGSMDRLLSVQKGLAMAQKAAQKIAAEGPKLAKTLAQGGVHTALDAVKNVVGLVQELDDALSKAPTIDVSTRLDKLTANAGIGKRATYTVKSKDITLNVNFEIVIDAGKLERVMVLRKESIIRDRLNFATVNNPGAPGSQSLPDTYAENVPNITRR